MPHVPFGLVLAAVPTAAVVELDWSDHPPAGTLGAAYKMLVTVHFASGDWEAVPFEFAATEGAEDVTDGFFHVFNGPNSVTWRKGLKVYLASHDGSAVTKLQVESTGPRPGIRWWPMAKPVKKPKK